MSKPSHTPGPWYVDKDGVWRDKFKKIVPLYAKQNAALVAAAPDMLAALKIARSAIHPHLGVEEDDAAYFAVKAAIAKAEGRS